MIVISNKKVWITKTVASSNKYRLEPRAILITV